MTSEPLPEPRKPQPFERIRARFLFLWVIPVIIAVLTITGTIGILWPEEPEPVWYEPLLAVVAYLLFFFVLLGYAKRFRIDLRRMVPPEVGVTQVSRAVLIALPLLCLSLGTIYLLYIPLSYVAPGFVEEILIEEPAWWSLSSDPLYPLALALEFIAVTIFAPIVEEIFFRGFLVHRWATKWSTRTAVLLSSVIFAGFHADVLGNFFFAYVLAMIYLKERSLTVPILIHMANNLVAQFLVFWGMAAPEGGESVAALQADWAWGGVGLAIGGIWLIRFLRKNPTLPTEVPDVATVETSPRC